MFLLELLSDLLTNMSVFSLYTNLIFKLLREAQAMFCDCCCAASHPHCKMAFGREYRICYM